MNVNILKDKNGLHYLRVDELTDFELAEFLKVITKLEKEKTKK